MMMRSMNSVFSEHQLLHCQIIEHCLMLDADVRKGEGVSRMRYKSGQGGRGRKTGIFRTSFMDDLISDSEWLKKRILHIVKQRD